MSDLDHDPTRLAPTPFVFKTSLQWAFEFDKACEDPERTEVPVDLVQAIRAEIADALDHQAKTHTELSRHPELASGPMTVRFAQQLSLGFAHKAAAFHSAAVDIRELT